MKKILATNPNNYLALIARLALAITLFPHGAQKLFGWFGGGGFNPTLGFLTGTAGLPWIIGLLVILIESIGSVLLFVGLITRIAAIGVIANFIGVVLSSHFYNSFFMNWARVGGNAEGLEYFIMLFGLALICLIAGGGKASLDAAFSKDASRKFSRLYK